MPIQKFYKDLHFSDVPLPRLGRISNVVHPRWHLLLALWKPTDVIPDDSSSVDFSSSYSNSSSSNTTNTISSSSSNSTNSQDEYFSRSFVIDNNSLGQSSSSSELPKNDEFIKSSSTIEYESYTQKSTLLSQEILNKPFLTSTLASENLEESESATNILAKDLDSSEATTDHFNKQRQSAYPSKKVRPKSQKFTETVVQEIVDIPSTSGWIGLEIPTGGPSFNSEESSEVSEVNGQILDMEVPGVMESNIKEPSLVPFIDQPKEILPMEGKKKKLLDMVKVAQGNEKLEDPFEVSSSITRDPREDKPSKKQISLNSPHFSKIIVKGNENENSTDTIIQILVGEGKNASSLANKNNNLIPIKPSKRKVKHRYRKKNTNFLIVPFPSNKLPKLKGVKKKNKKLDKIKNKPEKIKESTTPIYDEIAGTLHVDTSIDDVEDLDIMKKYTENNDIFITNSSDSHINLVEPEIHYSKNNTPTKPRKNEVNNKKTQKKKIETIDKQQTNKSKNNNTLSTSKVEQTKSTSQTPLLPTKTPSPTPHKNNIQLQENSSKKENTTLNRAKIEDDKTHLNILSNKESFDQALTNNQEENMNSQGEVFGDNDTINFNDTLYEDSIPLTIEDHNKLVLQERGKRSLLFYFQF